MRLARTLLLLALAVPVLLPASASAASEAYKVEKARLKDDKADLKAIEKLHGQWTKARAKGDHRTEHKVDAELIPWIKAEIEEAREELRLIIDETGAPPVLSGSPVRRPDDPPREPPKSTDKRVNRAMEEVDRLEEIRKELKEMVPAFDSEIATPEQYERKGALLDELVEGATQELSRQERRVEKAKAAE